MRRRQGAGASLQRAVSLRHHSLKDFSFVRPHVPAARPSIDGLPFRVVSASAIAQSPYARWLFYSHPAYLRAKAAYDLRSIYGEPLGTAEQTAKVRNFLDARHPNATAHERNFRKLLRLAQCSNWGVLISIPCYRAFLGEGGRPVLAMLGEGDGHFAAFLRSATKGVDADRVFLLPTNSCDGFLFTAQLYTPSDVGGLVRRRLAENTARLGASIAGRHVFLAGGAVSACLSDSLSLLGRGPRYRIFPRACYPNDFNVEGNPLQFRSAPWEVSQWGKVVDPSLRAELKELERVVISL